MGFFLNGNVITITKKSVTYAYCNRCNFVMYKEVHNLNRTVMQNLLYSIVILLLIFWALGYFIYNSGAIIHLLLIAAVIVVLLKIIKGEKV